MRARLGAALVTAIAIGFGLWTLAGLLAGGDAGLFSAATAGFLQIVVITAAFAVLIGILNLLLVHLGRLFSRQRSALYSLVLLLSFALVVGAYIVRRELSMVLLETVQVSVESALAGLLLFALVYGAYRLMRRRVSVWGVLFVAVILIVLIGALPLPGLQAMSDLSGWLFAVPVSAGARGILLGIALATVVAGVRVLIGQDRSYRE